MRGVYGNQRARVRTVTVGAAELESRPRWRTAISVGAVVILSTIAAVTAAKVLSPLRRLGRR